MIFFSEILMHLNRILNKLTLLIKDNRAFQKLRFIINHDDKIDAKLLTYLVWHQLVLSYIMYFEGSMKNEMDNIFEAFLNL